MSSRTANLPEYVSEIPDGDPGDDTFSVIDRHSAFDGTFRADRDLRVEGEVKGTIECQGTLFVAEGATVNAEVNAENVTVAGDLNGEIRCRGRLQMMSSGRVRGRVSTETLVINEGAYYEGELEMAAPEDRGKAPRPINSSLASAVALGSQSGDGNGGGRSAGSASTTFIRRLGQPEAPWASDPSAESPTEGEAESSGERQ